MAPNLQKYYEESFNMMSTQGWKDLVEDIDKIIVSLNNISVVSDEKANIKTKATNRLIEAEKELADTLKRLEEDKANPRASKKDISSLETKVEELNDVITNTRLISQAENFYIGEWETPSSNGKGVVVDGKTINLKENNNNYKYNVFSKFRKICNWY